MNKIVVISNERFEKGLIAFINSYRNVKMKTPLVIIDTGLKGTYPYETIKRDPNMGFKKAEWMVDCSPYQQLLLGDIEADKIIYMEVDMLLLKNIDHLFDYISDTNFIAVMDDAAKASIESLNNGFYIDSASRYFVEGSDLRKKFRYNKGYNGGLIGATRKQFINLDNMFTSYWNPLIEKQYRLLAQSFLNQYFIDEEIYVRDIGLEYNFSGINEYYDKPWLYSIHYEFNNPYVIFNGKDLSVLHFTGKEKPFLSKNINLLTNVWEYFYNKGELFNV